MLFTTFATSNRLKNKLGSKISEIIPFINLKIFVINNDGGGIFSTLSQRGVDGFEDVFGTPHGLVPAAIATSMGISAKTIGTQKELTTELSEPVKGMSVVVVNVPNRDANADFLKGIYKSISSM